MVPETETYIILVNCFIAELPPQLFGVFIVVVFKVKKGS